MNTGKVTRVEVIDEKGRSYVNWNENNKVQLDLQNDGRTLKVFIFKERKPVKESVDQSAAEDYIDYLNSRW